MKRLSFIFGSLATILVTGLLNVSLAAQAGARAHQEPASAGQQSQFATTAQVIPSHAGLLQACSWRRVRALPRVDVAQGAPTNDFPSDLKPEKAKARVMLRMVMDINKTISAGFTPLGKPANELVQVSVRDVPPRPGHSQRCAGRRWRRTGARPTVAATSRDIQRGADDSLRVPR